MAKINTLLEPLYVTADRKQGHKIAYLDYDENGNLEQVVSIPVDVANTTDHFMLVLDAIEERWKRNNAEMMKSAIAATLESLKMTTVTIDTERLATIWDRIESEIMISPDFRNQVTYLIRDRGVPK